MLPLVDLLVEYGQSVTAWVGSNEALTSDWKIGLLRERSEVRNLDAQLLVRVLDTYAKNRILNKIFSLSPGLSLLRIFAQVRVLENFQSVIVGWGDSGRFPLTLSRLLGIRLVCIPHGFTIFVGSRLTDATENPEVSLPDFSDRNRFSDYVVNNFNTKGFLLDCGVLESRIRILGNLRYSSSWSGVLERNAGLRPGRPKRLRKHLVFFLPNPNYRINWSHLAGLAQALRNSSWQVTVVPHIRDDVGAEALEFKTLLSALQSQSFVIETAATADNLVREADTVLFSGTSIGLTGILQGVPTFHLDFVTRNRTIFEELPGAHIQSISNMTNHAGEILPQENWLSEEVDRHQLATWWAKYVGDQDTLEQEWLSLLLR